MCEHVFIIVHIISTVGNMVVKRQCSRIVFTQFWQESFLWKALRQLVWNMSSTSEYALQCKDTWFQFSLKLSAHINILWQICNLRTHEHISAALKESYKKTTTWKVSIFGVFLVRIFPHLDWIRRDTSYLPALSPNAGKILRSLRIQSECGKMRTRKYPTTDTFHAVNYLLPNRQNSLCRVREISLRWILLVPVLIERYEHDSSLSKQKPCHGALNNQWRNLRLGPESYFRFHWHRVLE